MEDTTRVTETMVLDTIGGKLHRKFDHAGGTTMLGQLAFFIEFLQTSGLYERGIKSGTADQQQSSRVLRGGRAGYAVSSLTVREAPLPPHQQLTKAERWRAIAKYIIAQIITCKPPNPVTRLPAASGQMRNLA